MSWESRGTWGTGRPWGPCLLLMGVGNHGCYLEKSWGDSDKESGGCDSPMPPKNLLQDPLPGPPPRSFYCEGGVGKDSEQPGVGAGKPAVRASWGQVSWDTEDLNSSDT